MSETVNFALESNFVSVRVSDYRQQERVNDRCSDRCNRWGIQAPAAPVQTSARLARIDFQEGRVVSRLLVQGARASRYGAPILLGAAAAICVNVT